MKVQASINGDEVRITGKKRDDLQSMIDLLKQSDIGIPLQYQNFRTRHCYFLVFKSIN